MSAFRPTEVRIYRPYPDEVPWDLLADGGADEETLAAVVELNYLRVAKHERRAVGAYGIRPRSELCFELVTLVVAEGYRRQGLGRWLLGHAIGLAETRGAREIVAAAGAGQRFLAAAGFEPHGVGLKLYLTPE